MTVRKQQKDNRLIFKRLCKRFIFRIFVRSVIFVIKIALSEGYILTFGDLYA